MQDSIAVLLIAIPWVIFIAISPGLGSERMSALVPLAAFGIVVLRLRLAPAR